MAKLSTSPFRTWVFQLPSASDVRDRFTQPGEKGPNPLRYTRTSQAYRYPSENLKEIMARIEREVGMRDRDILTIAGSGLSIIGFLTAGARHITAIDVAESACAWAELATLLWQHVPLVDFRLFLSADRIDPLTADIAQRLDDMYRRVAPRLSPEARALMEEARDDGDSYFLKHCRHTPGYRYRTSYEPFDDTAHTADLLGAWTILNIDLAGAIDNLERRWDAIYLSNALVCLTEDMEDPYGVHMANRLRIIYLRHAMRRLNEGGFIAEYTHLRPDDVDVRHTLVSAARAAGLDTAIHPIPILFGGSKGVPGSLLLYRA